MREGAAHQTAFVMWAMELLRRLSRNEITTVPAACMDAGYHAITLHHSCALILLFPLADAMQVKQTRTWPAHSPGLATHFKCVRQYDAAQRMPGPFQGQEY